MVQMLLCWELAEVTLIHGICIRLSWEIESKIHVGIVTE